MPVIFTSVLFLVLFAMFVNAGLRLCVRPRTALDRIAGTVQAAPAPVHPSLVFHDLLAKLGRLMPVAPNSAGALKSRLVRAGYRGPNASAKFYGAKLLLALLLPLLAAVAARPQFDEGNGWAVVAAAAGAGFLAPDHYVRKTGARRQRQIRKGLPHTLDLLVVCVESGLGLDAAMVQAAKELQIAYPAISEELTLVNLELRAGNRRADALRNLAERSGVEELRQLSAVLIQADRFGTGIAQSLRGHSDFMRKQARQQVEEKAAKLGVKLVFPIFFFILPSLFVVTVGPVVAKIVQDLLPMMKNM